MKYVFKEQEDVSAEYQNIDAKAEKYPSKWNYVGIIIGISMLLFGFFPQVVRGTLPNLYYLGAAFWVWVIVKCYDNIQARNSK